MKNENDLEELNTSIIRAEEKHIMTECRELEDRFGENIHVLRELNKNILRAFRVLLRKYNTEMINTVIQNKCLIRI